MRGPDMSLTGATVVATINSLVVWCCATALAIAADNGTGKEMNNSIQPEVVIDRLISAIAARNLSGTMACFATGEDVAVIGSEQGEQAWGHQAVVAFFTRIYSKQGAYRFDLPRRTLTMHGDVAWLVADGSVTGPSGADGKPYRLTAVLIRDRDDFRVALWSGSEPVGP